ncbi:MAG: hypothetical protein HY260_04130 [Chloroflexi bacterium]|nr:hypothetical protein [Chloroflexota bacterium]
MGIRARVWLVQLLSLSLILGSAVTALAQQPEASRYFPETGHTARGPFLTYYDTRGGLEIFGYPLTDEFVDATTGVLVQYFQRARFEWHPENADPYKVQLGLLGQLLNRAMPRLGASQIPAANNPDCAYFAETGHAVCFSFLKYFNQKGGLDIFGFPTSEIVLENSRFVQYFQRARMEWYPERPAGQRVQLGLLGKIYYDFAGLDRSRLTPQPLSAADRRVTSLVVHASVENPITGRDGQQTVYVYVTDQQGQKLEGARVTLIAHLPKGDQALPLNLTSERGTTKVTFDVGRSTPGTAITLDVTAEFGTVAGDTRTSFLPWW